MDRPHQQFIYDFVRQADDAFRNYRMVEQPKLSLGNKPTALDNRCATELGINIESIVGPPGLVGIHFANPILQYQARNFNQSISRSDEKGCNPPSSHNTQMEATDERLQRLAVLSQGGSQLAALLHRNISEIGGNPTSGVSFLFDLAQDCEMRMFNFFKNEDRNGRQVEELNPDSIVMAVMFGSAKDRGYKISFGCQKFTTEDVLSCVGIVWSNEQALVNPESKLINPNNQVGFQIPSAWIEKDYLQKNLTARGYIRPPVESHWYYPHQQSKPEIDSMAVAVFQRYCEKNMTMCSTDLKDGKACQLKPLDDLPVKSSKQNLETVKECIAETFVVPAVQHSFQDLSLLLAGDVILCRRLHQFLWALRLKEADVKNILTRFHGRDPNIRAVTVVCIALWVKSQRDEATFANFTQVLQDKDLIHGKETVQEYCLTNGKMGNTLLNDPVELLELAKALKNSTSFVSNFDKFVHSFGFCGATLEKIEWEREGTVGHMDIAMALREGLEAWFSSYPHRATMGNLTSIFRMEEFAFSADIVGKFEPNAVGHSTK